MTVDDVVFYSEPGPMTDLGGCPHRAFDGLPEGPDALCRVVQGLLVHEEWASAYSLNLTDASRQQVRTRSAAQIVACLLDMDPAPLAQARPPARRMVGNCRHFATLSTALLRSAGVAARARCGFASYFDANRMVDHWVTEYRARNRWIRIDSQLDELQREVLKPTFDPDDMVGEAFLPAGRAWIRCRTGDDDPSRFGIFDMWGLWFINSNVIRDLAALNKMEMLPWDTWGPMTFREDPEPKQARLIDEIAATIDGGKLSEIQRLYQGPAGLAVHESVFDGRFGEVHHLTAEGRR